MDMRKVVAPQRDMMASINAGVTDVPGMTDEAARYFRDLYDHLIRLADLVDSYRDLLSSVMDTHLSTVSNRLNVVMKQLTVIATIFLPLSFLTGFFGQNFAFLVAHIIAPTGPSGSSASGSRWSPSSSSTCMFRAGAGWAARPSEASASGPVGRRGREVGRALRGVQPRTRSTRPRSRRGPGSPSCLRCSTTVRTTSFCSRSERQRPGQCVRVLGRLAGRPQRLLEAPGLAPAPRRARWSEAATSASRSGSALGHDVGRPQPAVVLVDAQQPGLHLEEADDVDHGVDGGERGALGQRDAEVRAAGGRPCRSCPWPAGRC